jgi:hypothetical protein
MLSKATITSRWQTYRRESSTYPAEEESEDDIDEGGEDDSNEDRIPLRNHARRLPLALFHIVTVPTLSPSQAIEPCRPTKLVTVSKSGGIRPERRKDCSTFCLICSRARVYKALLFSSLGDILSSIPMPGVWPPTHPCKATTCSRSSRSQWSPA